MCLDCGCGLGHEDHGNKKHITYEDLVAAKLDKVSVTDLVKALNKTVVSDRVKHPDEYDSKL